jgi:aspartate aminotransferase
MALLDPGDEVVVFSPYWVSYLPQIELAGGVPVVVRLSPEDGFQPDPQAVADAITDRTKVLLLNSPSNPTGTVWERSRIAAIVELAREHDLTIVSDEIYDAITYDGAEAICVPTLSDDAAGRTVIVHAVSKSFAMTGWRVGWMVGPPALIKACSKIHGHTTSGISPITQAAAEAALRADPAFRTPMLEALNARRHALVAGLAAVDGVELGPVPMGAFYAFPRVDGLFGRSFDGKALQSAMDVATYFIEHGGVAVVPGEAFGEPRCVRISYAVPHERLTEGLKRIAAAVEALQS